MPEDPMQRAAGARRRYTIAIALRDALTPGDPGYHDAVHDVGLRWAQVQYWERRAAREAIHAASRAGPLTTLINQKHGAA